MVDSHCHLNQISSIARRISSPLKNHSVFSQTQSAPIRMEISHPDAPAQPSYTCAAKRLDAQERHVVASEEVAVKLEQVPCEESRPLGSPVVRLPGALRMRVVTGGDGACIDTSGSMAAPSVTTWTSTPRRSVSVALPGTSAVLSRPVLPPPPPASALSRQLPPPSTSRAATLAVWAAASSLRHALVGSAANLAARAPAALNGDGGATAVRKDSRKCSTLRPSCRGVPPEASCSCKRFAAVWAPAQSETRGGDFGGDDADGFVKAGLGVEAPAGPRDGLTALGVSVRWPGDDGSTPDGAAGGCGPSHPKSFFAPDASSGHFSH